MCIYNKYITIHVNIYALYIMDAFQSTVFGFNIFSRIREYLSALKPDWKNVFIFKALPILSSSEG